MAFLPVYIRMKGNCTSLYTAKGEVYHMEKNVRTVLNQLSQIFLVDLKASRKYYGELLSMTNLVPIAFNQDNIFVPLKVRKPLCRNDGSIGYVNIKFIEKVKESNGKAIIHLKDKTTINSLNTATTANRHIKNGYIVKRLYKERHGTSLVQECDFYSEYNKPATKGDIALVMQEIMKIKETIR